MKQVAQQDAERARFLVEKVSRPPLFYTFLSPPPFNSVPIPVLLPGGVFCVTFSFSCPSPFLNSLPTFIFLLLVVFCCATSMMHTNKCASIGSHKAFVADVKEGAWFKPLSVPVGFVTPHPLPG